MSAIEWTTRHLTRMTSCLVGELCVQVEAVSAGRGPWPWYVSPLQPADPYDTWEVKGESPTFERAKTAAVAICLPVEVNRR
jgi:hypothetical protein